MAEMMADEKRKKRKTSSSAKINGREKCKKFTFPGPPSQDKFCKAFL